MVIILMGVMGSGKTTVGRKLSGVLGCPFYDADDLHSKANKEKLRRGSPLNDSDRMPWLRTIANEMKKWERENPMTVLACSALKQKYRDLLSKDAAVLWVYLKGDRETIRKRLKERVGHFADPSLLESQFADLEEPSNAVMVDIRLDLDKMLESLVQKIQAV
jgi:carbohydrate kinase (thermoresistant glucokinase family)